MGRYLFELGKGNEYTDMGCSPGMLKDLSIWLRQLKGKATSIYVAMYLFNNMEFYKVLKELWEAGCEIIIYSIPLEGYDTSNPATIKNHSSNLPIGKSAKYDLAERIYDEIKNNGNEKFQLRIVPHMYLRSKRIRKFSRGNMPYSLHCKTICVRCSDGTMYAGLTSSNMAVRDAQKIELGFIRRLNSVEIASAMDFYSGLYENSINVRDFDNEADYAHYKIKKRVTPAESNFMYIAPFYENSATRFEEIISCLVRGAKHRIIVCAQHICSFNYKYEYRHVDGSIEEITKDGFLADVLRKAQNGITTCFLSQTYVDETGSHKCRRPQNEYNFKAFVSAARRSNCHYYVNDNIHSKFIVVDDTVLITTCNFTPSQFLYLPNVEITEFKEMPGYSYSGIYSEFGAYNITVNHGFAEGIMAKLEEILNFPETKQMF